MWIVLASFGCVALGGLLAWQVRRNAALRQAIRAGEDALRGELAQRAHVERIAARNSAILKDAMDGFFVLDDQYYFLEVNEAFCRMTGYGADELRRLRITDLEVSQPLQPHAGSRLGTGLHHIASAHRHKSGHIVHFESCIIVLREEKGRVLAGFARDITERVRAEEAVRKSELKYRNLVETSRDLIWTVDREGRWTFVNNAVRSIYGYEPAEMLGRPFTDFMPPDQAIRDTAVFEGVKSGTPTFRHETTHLRRDGRPVHLSFNAIPLVDDHGLVIGTTGTATDVTQRLQTERKLRDANARVEALVAEMPLGYVLWSADGRVLDWNPAATAIYGYTREEALDRTLDELILDDESRPAFAALSARVLRGEACDGVTLGNRRKTGASFRCEWFNTLIQQPENGEFCVATMVRDVSEREALEAQLLQSQKLESLGVLAGGIAHDFNNLLVGILGNASIAMEAVSAHSAAHRHLLKVVNAGKRATELTQRMLAYAGRAVCEVEPLDLNSLVTDLVDFARSSSLKHAAIDLDLASDLPLIEADSGQVQQVIMNLLINGAEAIGDQLGGIRVATKCEGLTGPMIAERFAGQKLEPGAFVRLEVSDTGHGMSEETLARIFEPFFTTKLAGRGLGLSAIQGIVRAHRGAIKVESRIGHGTRFQVWFPVAAKPAASQSPLAAQRALPKGSTVLVIDDEEDIRDVVEAVLAARGIRVLTAVDGQDGIDIFRQHRHEIDVVLLDMNMPGLSGEAVFHELVALRSDVKVLLSSGYAEQETAARFSHAPLAGFVHKPYTAGTLVEKIGAVLS